LPPFARHGMSLFKFRHCLISLYVISIKQAFYFWILTFEFQQLPFCCFLVFQLLLPICQRTLPQPLKGLCIISLPL